MFIVNKSGSSNIIHLFIKIIEGINEYQYGLDTNWYGINYLYSSKCIIAENKNSKKDTQDFYQLFKKKTMDAEINKICKNRIFKNSVETQ
jgi:hypothetical protein